MIPRAISVFGSGILLVAAAACSASCGASDDETSAAAGGAAGTAGGGSAGNGGSVETGGSAGTGGAGTAGQSAGGSAGTSSGKTGEAKTYAGLSYASVSSSQKLDLMLPANATLPLPIVVRIHGGAFKGGSKSMEESGAAATEILARGYALAAVDYRLSGEAEFPAGAQDVKAAVRYLRANASTYGLDPDKFVSWGESAGGYFAVMLGVTGDQETVFDDDSLGNPDTSSAVQAVVDWFGPVDFATMDAQQQANPPAACPTSWQQHGIASSPESAWLGGALESTGETLQKANLTSYVAAAKKLPFFIMAHGNNDCLVPWGQSQELHDALAAVGAKDNLTILPGYSHADPGFEQTQTQPDMDLLDTTFGR